MADGAPQLTRDNTMQQTAKEGISFLQSQGKESLLNMQGLNNSGGSASASATDDKPKMPRDNTMIGTAKVGAPPAPTLLQPKIMAMAAPPGVLATPPLISPPKAVVQTTPPPAQKPVTVAQLTSAFPSAASHMTPPLRPPITQTIVISKPPSSSPPVSPKKSPVQITPTKLPTAPPIVVSSPPRSTPPKQPPAPIVVNLQQQTGPSASPPKPAPPVVRPPQQKSTPVMAVNVGAKRKEGAAILASVGKPDEDAQTRGQQKKIEEIQAEPPAKKPRMQKETTMAETAKEGKALLGGEKLGDTRTETKAKRDSRPTTKRSSTIDKVMAEAKELLKAEGFTDTSTGRVTRSSRSGRAPPPPPPAKKGRGAGKPAGAAKTPGKGRGRPKKNPAPVEETEKKGDEKMEEGATADAS
ncbi:proline-rich receptor-like protein kinase PERK2 isoform X2 [Lingula anatina]|uniref:Proline-rich receptor-like protein kinase PERK2 isoform X2 n=1 Tax=Lingula anatina TaxID=7574 RepID=A0A1S3I9C7_LINAN|nr:proline-rich receptor-like protein kinase PERK2 isoform X2 [Lingula anatina]|eukprot:XP_013393989.1 proline-rich receptor-like protein kinase PERK2 isoform X2 [Lingula anatina]